MSREVDKFKKSRRLAKTDAMIKRQQRLAKSLGVTHSHNQPHRYAKHHALDCGNTECLVCHSEKVFGKPTLQEQKFIQSNSDLDIG